MVGINQEKRYGIGFENTFTILSSFKLRFDDTQIIHVAGSNGKGTLCSLMAANLTLNKVSNVLFSSPIYAEWKKGLDWMADLFLVREFDNALRQVKDAAEDLSINPTFFETTFLASMIVTAERKTEISNYRNRPWRPIRCNEVCSC